MCHVSIAFDQSIQPPARQLDTVGASYVSPRSIRIVPVPWTSRIALELAA